MFIINYFHVICKMVLQNSSLPKCVSLPISVDVIKRYLIVKVIFLNTRIICRRKHAMLSSRVGFRLQIVLEVYSVQVNAG